MIVKSVHKRRSKMIPRCGSCNHFCDKLPQGIESMFTVIYNMEIHEFDGFCRLISEKQKSFPFILCLRRRSYTCGLWKWRGREKPEAF